MPRIVASEFLSPDGVMEDLGGSEGAAVGGWTFRRPNAGGLAFTLDDFRAHEALLLGRITDEVFAAAWPGRTDEIGFAARKHVMPTYVVSTTLTCSSSARAPGSSARPPIRPPLRSCRAPRWTRVP